MSYNQAFFAFQIAAARTLARRFALPLPDALFNYTTLPRSAVRREAWPAFAAGLTEAEDAAAYTYQWYLGDHDPDPQPGDTQFHGRPLFGCFYYLVRDETVIRPHFIKNDQTASPLSRARAEVRRAELRAMFAHIRQHEPQATTVLGNSWLYNLPAYRRLFPPAYTAELPEGEDGEFQFLARWGQLFDCRWDVRLPHGERFLVALEELASLDDLRHCFPFQIRQPHCAIAHFYDFYHRDVGSDDGGVMGTAVRRAARSKGHPDDQ
ncbi:MAG: hypothetical protein RLZZ387_4145 [Chloroflexota bacterium]|jgi:hypothetical protein